MVTKLTLHFHALILLYDPPRGRHRRGLRVLVLDLGAALGAVYF